MKGIKEYLITEENEKNNIYSIASQYGKLFLDTIMSFTKYLDEVGILGEVELSKPVQIANKEDYFAPGEVTAVRSGEDDRTISILVTYKKGAKPEWKRIIGVNGQDIISLDDLLTIYEKVVEEMKNKKK